MLEEASRGEVDLSGLWIARERAGRIAGVLLTQTLAGKAAAVWAPEMKTTWRRSSLAAALVAAALTDLTAEGSAWLRRCSTNRPARRRATT